MLSGIYHENEYLAIQYLNQVENYPIEKLCKFLKINRSAYYKWKKRTPSKNQLLNEQVVEWIKELYETQNGILGYRQMTITINRKHNVQLNKKRIYRLMKILHLKSVCRKKKSNYIKSTPEINN